MYESEQLRLKYIVSLQKKDAVYEDSPDQELINKELDGMINGELRNIPFRMKEIYDMKKEEGQSVNEIAKQLNLSEQTVKNQLHNAYGRLENLRKPITRLL